MANKTKHSKGYMFTILMLTITTIINMVLIGVLYGKSVIISKRASSAMGSINALSDNLHQANNEILLIVSKYDNIDFTNDNDIADSTIEINNRLANLGGKFGAISSILDNFNPNDTMSPEACERFNFAQAVIEAYRLNVMEGPNNFFATVNRGLDAPQTMTSSMKDFYTSEIYPLQLPATEWLGAAIDIANIEFAKSRAKGGQTFVIVEAAVVLVYILSLVAVLLMSRAAKKSQAVLEEREKNLADVDAKLKSTRQKASDLAFTNLLTGTKNRYALNEELTPLLENERFNIAVFDMDNFRSINDTYGYEFGDEYLAAVAEKLTEQFSSVAEIYNITGNEFCFLFNRDVSENQAMAHAQNIHSIMSSPYNVMNLTVQLTTSGALYHYLPGDCLNVNSLLVKLDTAMRNVKVNGGNMVTTVMNI